MGTKGAASAQRVAAAERREKAWELRKRGFSFRAIAEELERDAAVGGTYSKSQAERDVKRVLDDLQKRTVESAAEARLIDSDGEEIGRGTGTFMKSRIALSGLDGYATALRDGG